MSKVIVWENDDGTVSVTTPLEEMIEGETEDQYLDRIATKLQEDAPEQFGDLDYVKVDADDVPTSRRFRSCWRLDDDVVTTDVSLAKIQAKADVRAQRDQRLDASDKEWLRLQAVGTQQEKDDYAAFRQALRDLPETADTEIDACADEAALIAYTPTWPTEP
jgi:hypothetical protein